MRTSLATLHAVIIVLCAASGLAESAPDVSIPDAASVAFQLPSGMDEPPRAGRPTALSATVTDASGRPVTQRTPAAWLVRMPGEGSVSDEACRQLVQSYGRRTVFVKPEADLNAYQIVVLDEKGTILALDPLSGFRGSRLLGRVELGQRPLWWTLDHERGRLLTAMPDGGLATVSVGRWRLERMSALPARPTQVVFHAAQNQFHVLSGAGAQGMYRILNGDSFKEIQALHINDPHMLTLDDQGRKALIVTRDGVVMVDASTAKVQMWRPKNRITAVTWSPLASRFYLALADGSIAEWLKEQKKPTMTTHARIKAFRLTASPDGRWLFAFSPTADGIRVYDTARTAWLGTLELTHPAEVSVSNAYLYARSTADANIVLVPLDSFSARAQLIGKVLTGGTKPHVDGPLSSMAHVSGSGLTFWTSHKDRQIYVYHEGMNAPSGTLSTEGLSPIGVLLTRPLLQEQHPGVYTAWISPQYGGRYVVPFVLDTPPVVKCFTFQTVGPRPAQEMRPRIVPLSWPDAISVGEPVTLTFRVERPEENTIVSEFEVLLLSSSGMWQAKQPVQQHDGIYEITAQVPEQGLYWLFFSAPNEGLSYDQMPRFRLNAP